MKISYREAMRQALHDALSTDPRSDHTGPSPSADHSRARRGSSVTATPA